MRLAPSTLFHISLLTPQHNCTAHCTCAEACASARACHTTKCTHSAASHTWTRPPASRSLCQASQPPHCASTSPLSQARGLTLRAVRAPEETAAQASGCAGCHMSRLLLRLADRHEAVSSTLRSTILQPAKWAAQRQPSPQLLVARCGGGPLTSSRQHAHRTCRR